MLLRPRQKELVSRVITALQTYDNTLAVAPTAAGKTIMMSAVIGESLGLSPSGRVCVLAHRDELTFQNQTKFQRVFPHLPTSIFNSSEKNWQGAVTFAMVQTLSRDHNLASLPALDMLVIDEAHHARAETYLRIIDHAKNLNPHLKLLGMTATPNRGDKKGLRPIFSNVADQISVRELIASGHLVRPRTFVMDVGAQDQLDQVHQTAGDYDMDAVAEIMNTRPINEAVVAHWKERAGDRQTVVFCSTIQHAVDVLNAFIQARVPAVMVHGKMSDMEREGVLLAYATGAAQVIVNVAVLTEGWDDPPTSCVVLLRPSSYKSTMIQMIGRGLRIVNPEEYPGVVKTDCIILDFGTASLEHGSLEDDICLDDRYSLNTNGAAPTKTCPQCEGMVPIAALECSLCGYVFVFEDKSKTTGGLHEDDFTMREINLLFDLSNFAWVDAHGDQKAYMATGFKAWAGIFFKEGQWHAVGGLGKESAHALAVGEKNVCLSASDDWMNLHETKTTAHKDKDWLYLPATANQLKYLPEYQNKGHLTRSQASALMNLKFHGEAIDHVLKAGVAS